MSEESPVIVFTGLTLERDFTSISKAGGVCPGSHPRVIKEPVLQKDSLLITYPS